MLQSNDEKQDEYFKSNIKNLIFSANTNYYPKFTFFLDEHQQAMALSLLSFNHVTNYLFYGGTADCERVMLGIFPEHREPLKAEFPIKAVRVRHKGKENRLSHRDYLGALMSLQIKRETIGDIFIEDTSSVIFVNESVSEFIRTNLDRIGRLSVSVEEYEGEPFTAVRKVKEIQGSVSSLRLDCIVALSIHKSRSAVAAMISSGLVKVNGMEICNAAKPLSSGDKISIRGYGKFILDGDFKKTKKDKFFVHINKML